jgi:hypothetical protein
VTRGGLALVSRRVGEQTCIGAGPIRLSGVRPIRDIPCVSANISRRLIKLRRVQSGRITGSVEKASSPMRRNAMADTSVSALQSSVPRLPVRGPDK